MTNLEARQIKEGRFRPIWNFERKFLKSPVANVSVVAQVRGPIDPARIKKALGKLRQIHPLMASRVVEDPDHQAYLHTDNVPEIPLHVVKRESDQQWYDTLIAEHRTPFDPSTGPLIRFILVKSAEPDGISELIVFCQHTICDATALANLLRDALQHYAEPNLPLTLVIPPKTIEHILPQALIPKGMGSKIKRAIMQGMNKKWQKNPFLFTQQDFVDIHREYWKRKTYRFVLLDLPREETAQLNQRCRDQSVTINSALIIAFVKAYQDVVGPLPKNNIVVPYDLRKRSDHSVENVFCLFVSSIEISLKGILSADFWDSAKKLHNQIVKKINDRSTFGIIVDIQSLDGSILDTLGLATSAFYVPPESANYDKIQSFLKDKKNLANTFAEKFKNALPGAIMTNLGRMEFPESFGDIRLEKLYFTPSASEAIPLQLGAVGVSGTLTLTINYIDDLDQSHPERTEQYIQIRNRALDYLGLSHSVAKSNTPIVTAQP